MKPNFILELSHKGIRLLAAGEGATDVLGDIPLSDPDFDSKVSALRNDVAEKSDEPMATELRIPDSEILYTTLDDPPFERKSSKVSRADLREKAVQEALEGMTPYDLADLNYTWKIKKKGELCVAAVAHATLAEAEQFAASRSFHPVSFAAAPGNGKFKGKAEFGETTVMLNRAAAQKREAEEAAQARIAAEKAAQEAALAKPEPPEKSEVSAPSEVDTPSTKVSAASDSPPKSSKKAPVKADEPSEAAEASADAPGRRLRIAPLDGDAAPEPPAKEAPRTGFSQPRINDPLPPLDESEVVDDIPPMPVSFSTRRSANGPDKTPQVGPTDGTPEKDSRLSRIAARFAIAPDDDLAAPPPPRRTPGSKPASTARGSADKPGAPRPGGPRPAPAVTLPDTAEAAASLSPLTDAVGNPLLPPARAAVSARLAKGGKLSDAEAMTVFGARQASQDRSAKPVVIGLAVVAVLAIAAGTAFFLADNRQVSEAAQTPPSDEIAAEIPAAPDAPEEQAAVEIEPPAVPLDPDPSAADTEAAEAVPDVQPSPSTDVAALPDAQDDAQDIGAAPAGRSAQPDSTVATLGPLAPLAPSRDEGPGLQTPPAPLANDLLQRPPSEGEDPRARYATTGVWIDSPGAPEPPTTDRVDGIYTAAIDQPILPPAEAPRRLRSTTETPRPPLAQVPPAPAGQVFDLDERGLVRATPDGTMSPDGILIFAGPPPLAPPARPTRPTSLTPTAETQPDLPRIRPRDRPEGLVDETDQTNAGAQAVGPLTSRLAEVQPNPGPGEATAPEAPVIDTAEAAAPAAPTLEGPLLGPRLTNIQPRPRPDRESEQAAIEAAEVGSDAPTTETALPNPRLAALQPRRRPGSEDEPPTAESASDAENAETNFSNPRLAALQPRPRPGGETTTEAPATETAEAPSPEAPAVETALPDQRLTALQPRRRPGADDTAQADPVTDDIQDRARAAALAVAGASTATTQAPSSTIKPRRAPEDLVALRQSLPDVTPEPSAPLSPYAVAQSRIPKARPGNIDNLVATARARTPQQSAPAATVTRVASAGAIVTPRIPSRASVANQATVKNAINLGKINLIGVYGSTTNRRALVRLPSGRFVKVRVGDRVDGGRVAAIGQSQLSYTKSGRQVTLSMPRG